MADNVAITPGSGDTVAADDIGSVKYQRIKLILGADGVNDGDVASGNPLPVHGNVASGATDSGNPIKTGGKYNSTPPTLTNGQRGDTQLDSRANTRVADGAYEVRTPFNAVENDVDILVKASAGYLISVTVANYNATKRYLQIHNKATAPAASDVPVMSFPIPAGTSNAPGILGLNQFDWGDGGYYCSTGIGVTVSTTASTFTAATTTDHVIFGVYV